MIDSHAIKGDIDRFVHFCDIYKTSRTRKIFLMIKVVTTVIVKVAFK